MTAAPTRAPRQQRAAPCSGLALSAIQVEAILVSLVPFLGVQAAWILLVEPPRSGSDEATGD